MKSIEMSLLLFGCVLETLHSLKNVSIVFGGGIKSS